MFFDPPPDLFAPSRPVAAAKKVAKKPVKNAAPKKE